jgi:hypothetical protein
MFGFCKMLVSFLMVAQLVASEVVLSSIELDLLQSMNEEYYSNIDPISKHS